MRESALALLPLALAIAGCSPIDLPGSSPATPTSFDQPPSTPTQSMDSTSEPNGYVSPGPLSSPTPGPNQPMGTLYVWNRGTEGNSEYGRLDPSQFNIGINHIQPQDEVVRGPADALALAFSRYSSQVAYVTTSGRLQLWIADSELQQVALAWTDTSDWMAGAPQETLDVNWGPGDKSVIVSGPEVDHVLIYSLSTREVLQWEGACDEIADTPDSDGRALWCVPAEDRSEQYAFVDPAGTLQTSASAPADPIRSVEWAFSPDSTMVLVADQDLALKVLGDDGDILDLEATYALPAPDWEWRGLQWSHDRSALLVFGSPHRPGLCPTFTEYVTGEVHERPCWLVLDSASGDVLWHPDESLATALGIVWGRVRFDFAASISPDGNGVALFIAEFPIRWSLNISIEGGAPTQFYTSLVDIVSWQPPDR